MKRKHLYISYLFLLLCFSCQKKMPKQNPVDETALCFCQAFYNLNYPEAKEWATSSSLSYLSFLASNTQQVHLDQLKAQGEANISILSSQVNNGSQEATVICLVKNVLRVNPISGKGEMISTMQDTLHLVKNEDKWLVRRDIPQQNGMRNLD